MIIMINDDNDHINVNNNENFIIFFLFWTQENSFVSFFSNDFYFCLCRYNNKSVVRFLSLKKVDFSPESYPQVKQYNKYCNYMN